jgi:mannose-6-phosphate isomerase-like protein (cupin superfamily)
MPAVAPTHHAGHIDWSQAVVPPGYERASRGFSRQPLVDGDTGSVHMGVAACALAGDGHVRSHVHSFEESFYVLEGRIRLAMQGTIVELGPDHCGLIPVGVAHSWTGAGTGGRWIEMAAPRPRAPAEGRAADTFFVEESAEPTFDATPADIRDPRTRHLYRLNAFDTDIESLRRGSAVDAPTVSASMATALLVYSGISVKMLVDQRLDAQLSTMFIVEYQPGGVAHPHDHPLEEFYAILDGEVEAVADGRRYTLRQGDVFWTSVGCVHAFYNTCSGTVRWLETQAPQPPARHSYRFERDWEYLRDRLESRR